MLLLQWKSWPSNMCGYSIFEIYLHLHVLMLLLLLLVYLLFCLSTRFVAHLCCKLMLYQTIIKKKLLNNFPPLTPMLDLLKTLLFLPKVQLKVIMHEGNTIFLNVTVLLFLGLSAYILDLIFLNINTEQARK